MTALLVVLYCTLATLLVTSVVIFSKKDGKKHEKVSLIATLSMSIATIVVGISTVEVGKSTINETKRAEAMQKNLLQPLFSVKTTLNYSDEKSVFDNEEYIITNVGAKTKSKTDVRVSSFLEIEYHDTKNNSDRIRKSIPIVYFGGATIVTNNLDGEIEHSNFSGNNNECFGKLYHDALRYAAKHPGIYVTVQIKHYFSLDYIDINGEKHHIVKTVENEIDPDEFTKMKEEAEQNAKGNVFFIKDLNLGFVLSLLFE